MPAACRLCPIRPRAGSGLRRLRVLLSWLFQSTLPSRGATGFYVRDAIPGDIRFNPRSPRGEPTAFRSGNSLRGQELFSSTLPARGATSDHARTLQACDDRFNPRSPRGERRCERNHALSSVVLTTLPARGATYVIARPRTRSGKFQSTLPGRGATPQQTPSSTLRESFQLHAPRAGRRRSQHGNCFVGSGNVSIHASPRGERHVMQNSRY